MRCWQCCHSTARGSPLSTNDPTVRDLSGATPRSASSASSRMTKADITGPISGRTASSCGRASIPRRSRRASKTSAAGRSASSSSRAGTGPRRDRIEGRRPRWHSLPPSSRRSASALAPSTPSVTTTTALHHRREHHALYRREHAQFQEPGCGHPRPSGRRAVNARLLANLTCRSHWPPGGPGPRYRSCRPRS
jgi:hypothetical protein